MKFRARLLLAALLVGWLVRPASAAVNFYSFTYTNSPASNPLRGFIPYQGTYSTFPYGMEWQYLSLRSLMTGPTNFNWAPLETILNDVASRGHQTTFRVYLDYPAKPTGIPQFLLDGGLATTSYTDYGNASCTNYNNSTLGNCKGSVSPDYTNPNLQQALTNFIAAFGARYDGDPRIGFLTIGLLGYWGEWHTYPHPSWFASAAVQDEVMAAYNSAFHKTKLLARYPSSIAAPYHLGFHDDSFAWDTLPPISGTCFLGAMQSVPGLTNGWLTQAIGGELRPEVQLCIWNTTPTNCVPAGQAFSNCVPATHATWMINQGVFSPGFTGASKNLALAAAQTMGYELYVTNALVADARVSTPLNVSVLIRNTGVAPFYYDWPVQLSALNASHQAVQTWTTPWQLSSLEPATNQLWSFTQTNHGLAAGQYRLVMRAQNPLVNGVPLRFANTTQDADLAGWLTLGTFSVFTNIAPPLLSATGTNAGFQMQVSGAAPGSWLVERSVNFTGWTTLLATNTATSRWDFIDPRLAPWGFYRVVSPP